MNNKDKELLELAAKAAGIEIAYWHSNGNPTFYDENESPRYWNPLEYDGDAFRLAVKLFLWVQVSEKCAWAQQNGDLILGQASADSMVMFSETENDKTAATRRAIVRVAAAIGRDM